MNELLMEKIALLPEEIKNLLKVIVSDEHFVTLVGGAVRDILLGRGIPSNLCLLYTSPSPRDGLLSRMPSSA